MRPVYLGGIYGKTKSNKIVKKTQPHGGGVVEVCSKIKQLAVRLSHVNHLYHHKDNKNYCFNTVFHENNNSPQPLWLQAIKIQLFRISYKKIVEFHYVWIILRHVILD